MASHRANYVFRVIKRVKICELVTPHEIRSLEVITSEETQS